MADGEAQQLYGRPGDVHREEEGAGAQSSRPGVPVGAEGVAAVGDGAAGREGEGFGGEGVEGGRAAQAGEQGEVDGVGEEADGGEAEEFAAGGLRAGERAPGRAPVSVAPRARAYQSATASPYIASHTTPMTVRARSRRTTSSGSPAVPRSAKTA